MVEKEIRGGICCDMVRHELRVMSYELRFASYELQITS